MHREPGKKTENQEKYREPGKKTENQESQY